MGSKLFQDEVLPPDGRKYEITSNGDGTSKIKDVTRYDQYGSSFGAKEVLEQCFIECDYEYDPTRFMHKITTPNSSAKNIKVFFTEPFLPLLQKVKLNDVVMQVKTSSGKQVFSDTIEKNTYAFFFVKGTTLYYVGENQNIVFDDNNIPHKLTVERSILNLDSTPVGLPLICPVRKNFSGSFFVPSGLKGLGTTNASIVHEKLKTFVFNRGFFPTVIVRPIIDIDGDGAIDAGDWRLVDAWINEENDLTSIDIFGNPETAQGVVFMYLKKFENGVFFFEGLQGSKTATLQISADELTLTNYT